MDRAFPLCTALASTLDDTSEENARVRDEGLEDALAAQLAAASLRYPGLTTAPTEVLAYVGARLDTSKAPRDALSEIEFSDLVLACAASRGETAAIVYFEEHGMRGTETSLQRRGVANDVIEEAKQNVRERMLVHTDAQPARILDYNGRGPLKHWLRVAVVREGIYLAKREGKHEPVTFDFLSLPAAGDDPELAFFKRRYRNEYKQAFETATEELSSRERALLRQQYLLGMSVDEIGAIYQVHRATAARWVQAARETLFAKARIALAQRLGVPRTEIEEIVRMIESQLDVSLNRLLTTRSQGAGARPT